MRTRGAEKHSFTKNPCLGGIVAILVLTGTVSAQSFSPSSPAREYIRLGDRIVGMESGRTSPNGAAVQVFLEMVDRGIQSTSTGMTNSLGTQLRLDPADYDGASYSFEVVGTNTDSVNRQVELLDSGNVVTASVTVPSGTSNATRFRSATFTPNAGPTVYTIRLAQTTSAAQLKVYTGRIVVDQVGGTKTRIQIPLANYLSGTGTQQWIESTNSTTYGQNFPQYFSIFYRDNDRYDAVVAWEFEVVSAASGAGTHLTSLFTRAGTQLTTSEVSRTGSAVQLSVVDITNDANFTNLTEFEVRHKTSSVASGTLYRAALYLRLGAFTKADVYHRISRYHTALLSGYNTDSRLLFEVWKLSNPTIYFESVGWENTAGAQKRSIANMATSDSGTPATPEPVSGSEIDFSSSTKTRIRTGPFQLTSGNRYALYVDTGNGATAASTSFVVIAVVR